MLSVTTDKKNDQLSITVQDVREQRKFVAEFRHTGRRASSQAVRRFEKTCIAPCVSRGCATKSV